MSARKQRAAVVREHHPDPERCVRAIELLLQPVRKNATSEATRPRKATERRVRRAMEIPG